jgi:tetratricopeptide (TPR) repeat protein
MKAPGDTVDRYVIEAQLGRGGMGEVYEATDTRLGRRVALKLITPGVDPDANQRMVREARAAASFEHPHAVVVYDVGEHEGATFLAMELVRGATLRAHVGDPSAPVGRRLRWLCDVARALGAAHRQGIVHRDVKPDNVMIREDGAAKVLDFGIARRQSRAIDPSAPTEPGSTPMATLTAHGVIVGTPHYAAPEQLRGEPLDGRADEFAWGVMAYEVLSGATPWGASDSVALLSQILSAAPRPLAERAPELPAPVVAAVMRALEKRPDDRFPTIEEAADALEPFADAAASTGKREASPPLGAATPRPTALRRVVRGTGKAVLWFFALIGGLIVLTVVGAIVLGLSRGDLVVSGKSLGPRTLTVPALGCQDARIQGPDATPELGQAIGRAACARVATALGVDWGGDAANKLVVTVTLAAGEARVKLAVQTIEAEGKGTTPIDAIAAALPELQKRLTPPPLDDAAVRSWGAADAAGARRIERVWRELLLNITPDADASVKALTASDPGSAWSHMLFALVRPRRTEESRAAIRGGLERLDALPPARAHALRGTLLIVEGGDAAALKEAMRLLRLAYTEAPDDGDVASLYAAVAMAEGAEDEALGVLDRLYTRFPAKSVLALRNAISAGVSRDLERDGRYVQKARAILPEAFAWDESVHYLVESGRFDEARAALAFGRRLGLTGKNMDAAPLDAAQVWLDLAALDPRAAREGAARLRGDPRPSVSSGAAAYSVASYLLEGRIADAEAAELGEIDRQRAVGTPEAAASFAFQILRVRRYLGRPTREPELLAAVETFAAEVDHLAPGVCRVLLEPAFARAAAAPKDAKRLLAAALDRCDARADAERDQLRGDTARLSALPLVRAVRGDEAAARVWLESPRAPFTMRRFVALDAGLALEAAGKPAEAQAAYVLATDPRDLERHALEAMLARVKLAALRRAAGKADEAALLEATVARVWQRADAGVADAAKRLR